MKITDGTTIAEADVERMRLGIASMYVSITLVDGRRNVEVLGVTAEGVLTAVAEDWATALAIVFEKRAKQLASYFAPRDRIGHIALALGWCEPVEVVHGKPGREPYRRPEIIRPRASERCSVPMCGESGVCDDCRAKGAR